MKKVNKGFAIRLAFYILGLFLVAISLRLSIVANLGVGPGAVLSLVLQELTAVDISVWGFVLAVVYVIVQIAILKKNFKLISLLQLLFSFIFSLFVAKVTPLVSWWVSTSYIIRLIQLFISVALTGLGIYFVVVARLIAMPPECMILAILTKVKGTVGKFRILFDVSHGVIGIVLSLISLGTIIAFREGTVILAILPGLFVDIYDKVIGRPVKRLMFGKDVQLR